MCFPTNSVRFRGKTTQVQPAGKKKSENFPLWKDLFIYSSTFSQFINFPEHTTVPNLLTDDQLLFFLSHSDVLKFARLSSTLSILIFFPQFFVQTCPFILFLCIFCHTCDFSKRAQSIQWRSERHKSHSYVDILPSSGLLLCCHIVASLLLPQQW